jgi:hypothetical protein
VTLPAAPSSGPFSHWNPESTPTGTGPGAVEAVKGPSAAGYWIGAAIGAVGVIASVTWFVMTVVGVAGAADAYPRFTVPGSRTVQLDAVTYKVFVEYPGANLDFSQAPLVGGLSVSDEQGRAVPMSNAVINETYSWNGRDGRAIGQFTPPRSGRYTVSANSARETSTRVVDVAIGRGLDISVVGPILGSMALGGVAVLIALVLIIVTLVRRSRWKRAQRPPISFGGYGVPPGAMAYGAPGPGYPGGLPAGLGDGFGPPDPSPSAMPAPPAAPGPPAPLSPPAPWGAPPTAAPPTSDPWSGPGAPPASSPGVHTPPWSPPPVAPPAVRPPPWSPPPVAPPAVRPPSSAAPAHPPGWESAPGVSQPTQPTQPSPHPDAGPSEP